MLLHCKVEHFVQQHHSALIKFFTTRLNCAQDAKDVAQETYEWLLQHQHDPRVVAWLGPIDPLVYRVAWNIAGNRILKHHRHARLANRLFDATNPVAPAPEDVCAAREDLTTVAASLNELSPRCRTAFILAELEGLAFEEIATTLGISVRSVYRHVDRALDHCLQRLRQVEQGHCYVSARVSRRENLASAQP